MNNYLKKFIYFIILIMTLNSCGNSDTWTGYVYPDASNLLNSKYIGSFSSLEDCRASCLDTIRSNNYQNADYECGLNCKVKDGINICEKTSS